MTTHTLCFRSLIKKVIDVWNSEVDSMKKISKMVDFQGTASWCITTRVRIRHVMIPLVLPHRTPEYFLDLSKQVKQNTCNIQFIESFYLKYGIYKPQEVKKSYKKTRACALVSLSDFSPPSVYKSHISNRTINKLYWMSFLKLGSWASWILGKGIWENLMESKRTGRPF